MFKPVPSAARSIRKTALASGFAVAFAIAAGAAHAADDGTLTWNGITLYGTLDIGVAYQTHGTSLSDDFYTGLGYLVSKNSNKSITSVAPNGLSQSKIGVKGLEPLTDDLSAVFNAELGFNPQSGKISDALQSLVNNNGRAVNNQSTNADGSRAGQVFNGPAFLGISSKTFGTLTAGRHNTLQLDNVIKYDPMGASYAFSVIGYSGATAGMGNTENARLDDSVKYTYAHGPLRVGGLYQFSRRGGDNSNGGAAAQLDVGFDYNGFSADFLYGYKNGAISASPLSAAQLATPGVKHDSLAASVSDTTAWAANGSWTNGPWKLTGGYEHIEFENPEHPLVPGFSGLGGYEFSFVNNTAYSAHHRILQVSWFGAKYQISKELSITGAYYHYDQNSYGAVRCSNTSAGTCEGTLDAYSVMGDYRFTKRFDIYAGVMYSTVHDGLASGYLHDNSADPMIGFRYSF